jgi:heat-inducible transcriptional repressor
LEHSRIVYELDVRKATILRAIIHDYVQTAEPVGSEAIAQKYSLGVKPATVRNEMAVMSDWGYLHQPHTSAGRVPSDRGYRYYVENLYTPQGNVQVQRMMRHLPSHGESLTEMLAGSLRLLANATHYAAVATTARDENLTLTRCVLAPYKEERMLLVCVFDNGYVENRLVDFGKPMSAAALGRIQNAIASLFEGKPTTSLLKTDLSAVPKMERAEEQTALERTFKAVQNAAQEAARGELFYEGALHMVDKPEFQRQVSLLESVLRVLEDKRPVYDTMEKHGSDDLQVMIGEENSIEALQPCTLVFARYYTGNRPGGAIGVLGPTRMDYDHTLPIVKRIAEGLSQVLKKTYTDA